MRSADAKASRCRGRCNVKWICCVRSAGAWRMRHLQLTRRDNATPAPACRMATFHTKQKNNKWLTYNLCHISDAPYNFFFEESCMGNQMLVIDGYRYSLVRRRSNDYRNKWRCGRHNSGCKATALTVDKKLVAISGCHNHDQWSTKSRVMKSLDRSDR